MTNPALAPSCEWSEPCLWDDDADACPCEEPEPEPDWPAVVDVPTRGLL